MTIYVHYDPETGLIESLGNCVHSMHREGLLVVELEQQPDTERQKIDIATGNMIDLTEQEIFERVSANENTLDAFLIAARNRNQ